MTTELFEGIVYKLTKTKVLEIENGILFNVITGIIKKNLDLQLELNSN